MDDPIRMLLSELEDQILERKDLADRDRVNPTGLLRGGDGWQSKSQTFFKVKAYSFQEAHFHIIKGKIKTHSHEQQERIEKIHIA